MQGPDIKSFHIDGAVKTLQDLDNKQLFEEFRLKKRMLNKGFVPVLDVTPLVATRYDAEKETFRYVITVYGVKVEGDAWLYEGWMNGKLISATLGTKFERLLSRSGLK